MNISKKVLGMLTAAALVVTPVSMVATPVVAYAATSSATEVDAGEVSKPKKVKATTKKNKATISWQNNNDAAGYEIQYSTSKNFKKGTKTVKAKYTAKSATLKKLKKNTTYYVRVRSYKNVKVKIDGKVKKIKVYTGWVTKKIKTKKK